MEKRVASLFPTGDGCAVQRHEDGFDQRQLRAMGADERLLCRSVCFDRSASHVVGLHRARKLHSSKGMGQEARVLGLGLAHFYWCCVEHQNHHQLCSVYDGKDIPGPGLGCVRYHGDGIHHGYILCKNNFPSYEYGLHI